MNAETGFPTLAGPDPWTRATHEVNAWRGACLQCFSRGEEAVRETLLALRAIPERGAAVGLRHLMGQQFEDLAAMLGPEGEFAAEGAGPTEAIQAMREHEHLRNMLAHGVVTVAVERSEKWVAIIRNLTIRSGGAEDLKLSLRECEAIELLSEIKRKSNRVSAILHRLRMGLAPAP